MSVSSLCAESIKSGMIISRQGFQESYFLYEALSSILGVQSDFPE